MSLRIVIVGGTGFLGSSIAEALVTRGHHVRSISRRPAENPVQGVNYAHINLETCPALGRLVKDADAVVHLFSTTTPLLAASDPARDALTNLLPTLRLLDACHNYQVGRVIYASSGGTVYGPSCLSLINEQHPARPVTPYGIIKLAIEHYLGYYQVKHGLEYVILRVANAYGPTQRLGRSQGIVGELLAALARETAFVLWGDGSAIRDYVYIDDVASAFVAAIETKETSAVNCIYNIGTGRGTSVHELLCLAEGITGRRVHIQRTADRSAGVTRNVLDSTQAADRLKWHPLTSLEEGLRLTWKSLTESP